MTRLHPVAWLAAAGVALALAGCQRESAPKPDATDNSAASATRSAGGPGTGLAGGMSPGPAPATASNASSAVPAGGPQLTSKGAVGNR